MRRIRVLFPIIILCILCCLCSSCGGAGEKEYSYTVMYLNSQMTGLVEDEYDSAYAGDQTEALLEELLRQLRLGGDDANKKSPISENVEVLGYQLEHSQLSLSFSAAYYEKSGLEEILSRAAIVETLCQVEGIDYVEFYIEDQPLMLAGNAVGLMNPDRFVLNLNNRGKEQSRQVTLYFANAAGDRLREVTASVTYDSVTPLAEMLVQQLIRGEETLRAMKGEHTGVQPSIPDDTVLNSLTIRGQVCYVDLGSGFNNLLSGISSEVSVYSLVNTLCELPNVNRVQITIDGEPQEKYGEMEAFSTVLERKLDLVEEK